MAEDLALKKCEACGGDLSPLKGAALDEYRRGLGEGWRVVDDHHLVKTFKFKDFRGAVAFTNQVADVAEAENHHPDLDVSWGKVRVTLFTHKAGGLTENDFILAAKIDRIE